MGNEEVTSWIQDLQDTTFVIQLTANKLYGFRSDRGGISHQIDNVLLENEAKLIRQFSRILYLKLQNENEASSYKSDNFGGIDLWLNIVNVGENTAKALKTEINAVEELLQYSDVDMEQLCDRCGITGDDRRRLATATRKLKMYTKRWLEDKREPKDEFTDADLFWVSYERSNLLKSPHFSRENPNRRSVSESGVDSGASDSGLGSHLSQASLPTASPPASPASFTSSGANAVQNVANVQAPSSHLPPKSPSSLFTWSFGGSAGRVVTPPGTHSNAVNQKTSSTSSAASAQMKKISVCGKAPTTPPPTMKWGTSTFSYNAQTQQSPGSPATCMTRSRSHDSNLPNRIVRAEPVRPVSSTIAPSAPSTSSLGRNFVLPLAQPSTSSAMSPDQPSSYSDAPLLSPSFSFISPTSGESQSLQVPKSPRTAVRMVHNINHRFNRMWKPSMQLCFYCNKSIGLSGERCSDCKIKVHTLCKPLVGPTCGLTAQRLRQIYDYILQTKEESTFPVSSLQMVDVAGKRVDRSLPNSASSSFLGSDMAQSSSSSCTSSAPSTPAAICGVPQPSPGVQVVRQQPKFAFPDVYDVPNITVDEASEFRGSQGSDHTIHNSNEGSFGEAGSEPTLSPDDVADSMGSNDSNFSNSHEWRRDTWSKSTMRRNAWGEWTIPIEEIQFRPDPSTRRGRFGEVYRAYWHQDVAVKLLNMDHVDDEKQLETFKLEVSTFRSTRHENLVLFLGCCMNPPKLGIVMNWCRGPTLYTLLHVRGERLDMNRVINIAIHISQGMSYLHGKKIVHKDLRTKNVFIEKNKAVITDFGLFSLGRLLRTEQTAEPSLHVPEHWLCYLAPEIMRNLLKRTADNDFEELPFSNATDVYAFGTVWYELITNEFPFKRLPPEAIIFQVGQGVKPALNNIPAVKEVKDVLMQCWASKAADRHDFNGILKTFEKMPRKRLARSPSHPVHVSRSAEAVF